MELLLFSFFDLMSCSFSFSLLDGTLTLKIADFGLTLKKTAIQLDSLGKVPIKWLAKEVGFLFFFVSYFRKMLISFFFFTDVGTGHLQSEDRCLVVRSALLGDIHRWRGTLSRNVEFASACNDPDAWTPYGNPAGKLLERL